MRKNEIFCHCCDSEIPYREKAWSKNDGESTCPLFCSPDCLCDYYDYYYHKAPIDDELNISCAHCNRQLSSDYTFWLNNDLFGDMPILLFCSPKCLCEHYGYIFDWRGEPEFIDDDCDDNK